MEKLAAQKTEKNGKISGQKLTEKATAPQKPPPPARKTDLQVCAAADKNKYKLGTNARRSSVRENERERETERERG